MKNAVFADHIGILIQLTTIFERTTPIVLSLRHLFNKPLLTTDAAKSHCILFPPPPLHLVSTSTTLPPASPAPTFLFFISLPSFWATAGARRRGRKRGDQAHRDRPAQGFRDGGVRRAGLCEREAREKNET